MIREEYKHLRGTERSQEVLDRRKNVIKLPDDVGEVTSLTKVIHLMICRKIPTVNSQEKVHCTGTRRRSSDDIYRVAKYYMKDITLAQVKESLSKLVDSYLIYNNYCPTVRKWVHMNRNVQQPTLNDIKKIVKI